jgi:hypothetical protein
MRLGNAFKLLIDAVAIPSHQRNKLVQRTGRLLEQ